MNLTDSPFLKTRLSTVKQLDVKDWRFTRLVNRLRSAYHSIERYECSGRYPTSCHDARARIMIRVLPSGRSQPLLREEVRAGAKPVQLHEKDRGIGDESVGRNGRKPLRRRRWRRKQRNQEVREGKGEGQMVANARKDEACTVPLLAVDLCPPDRFVGGNSVLRISRRLPFKRQFAQVENLYFYIFRT